MIDYFWGKASVDGQIVFICAVIKVPITDISFQFLFFSFWHCENLPSVALTVKKNHRGNINKLKETVLPGRRDICLFLGGQIS